MRFTAPKESSYLPTYIVRLEYFEAPLDGFNKRLVKFNDGDSDGDKFNHKRKKAYDLS